MAGTCVACGALFRQGEPMWLLTEFTAAYLGPEPNHSRRAVLCSRECVKNYVALTDEEG